MRIWLALLFALMAGPVRAGEPLVADLSKHLVAITTGFAGADVLLFGAVEDYPDGDVVVVVRGPNRHETVRRKERQAGIWVNRAQAEISNVPTFYGVAATRALDQIASSALLDRHQIGLDHLVLKVAASDPGDDPHQWRQALIRAKQERGLYPLAIQDIGFLSQRLFRTDMHFPANVPVGTYLVEVYLIHQGKVISAQTTPLIVSKSGLGADLFDFAHQRAALYGMISVMLSALVGWAAAKALKR